MRSWIRRIALALVGLVVLAVAGVAGTAIALYLAIVSDLPDLQGIDDYRPPLASTVYDRDGRYQIIVRSLESAGKGDLHARFEILKAQLLKEGLFDAARKRPLPVLPRCVGIVTSPTGAAIRDILNVIARRFPNRPQRHSSP